MAKTDLSDIIQLLQFTGHYFNFSGCKNEKLYGKLQKLRVVLMVMCNPFCLSSLFIGGLKKSMGVELFFGLIGFLTALQHVYAYKRRKEIEEIIQAILRIRHKYQKGSDAEFHRNTRVIWIVVYVYFAAMTSIVLLYIILPKVCDIIYGVVWNDPVALRLPQSMDAFLDEHQHRLIKNRHRSSWNRFRDEFVTVTVSFVKYSVPRNSDSWNGPPLVVGPRHRQRLSKLLQASFKEFARLLRYQLRIKKNLKYAVVSVTSSVWSTVSTYSHFGLDSLLCLAGFYYSSLVKTFCNRLKLDTRLSPEKLEVQMKTFAAHHRELYRLSLKMRSFFGCPYAMQNNFGAFCIVSLVYAILSDSSVGPLILVANLFNLMILAGMLTSTACVGQHLTNETSAVFDALYDLPWYELRPSSRKYLVTMICAARMPFTINFHGQAPLNLTHYMAILNTSYSYFMFMRSTL